MTAPSLIFRFCRRTKPRLVFQRLPSINEIVILPVPRRHLQSGPSTAGRREQQECGCSGKSGEEGLDDATAGCVRRLGWTFIAGVVVLGTMDRARLEEENGELRGLLEGREGGRGSGRGRELLAPREDGRVEETKKACYRLI